MADAEKLVLARLKMVREQLRARGITDEGVLAAFADVPRELFVPPEQRGQAYEDRPLPIGYGQTISQPYIAALMVQELAPQGRSRVLDVGAGSGYQAAILACLVRHVYAVERIEDLTEQAARLLCELNVTNVTLYTGDGMLGWPQEAPFDGIISGASSPQVPQPWLDQLADGGRIVLPLGPEEGQMLTRIQRRGDQFLRQELCPVQFVPLIGEEEPNDESR